MTSTPSQTSFHLSPSEASRVAEISEPKLTDEQFAKWVPDARLVALMPTRGITHILTLNGSDFTRYPGVTVIDPANP